MNIVEISEPDGNVNWDEDIYEEMSDNDSSSSLKSVPPLVNEEPQYSFSNMYGSTQTINNDLAYDPPASNTRRRKKAP